MYSQVSFAKGIPLNFHLKKHIDYLKCHNRLMIDINQVKAGLILRGDNGYMEKWISELDFVVWMYFHLQNPITKN